MRVRANQRYYDPNNSSSEILSALKTRRDTLRSELSNLCKRIQTEIENECSPLQRSIQCLTIESIQSVTDAECIQKEAEKDRLEQEIHKIKATIISKYATQNDALKKELSIVSEEIDSIYAKIKQEKQTRPPSQQTRFVGINPAAVKACIFYNGSSDSCRNGVDCQFRHEHHEQPQRIKMGGNIKNRESPKPKLSPPPPPPPLMETIFGRERRLELELAEEERRMRAKKAETIPSNWLVQTPLEYIRQRERGSQRREEESMDRHYRELREKESMDRRDRERREEKREMERERKMERESDESMGMDRRDIKRREEEREREREREMDRAELRSWNQWH